MEEEDSDSSLVKILERIPDSSLLEGLDGILNGNGLVPCYKIAVLLKRIKGKLEELDERLKRGYKIFRTNQHKKKLYDEIREYENIREVLGKYHAKLFNNLGK